MSIEWTPVELGLLRDLYPEGGWRACHARMPNRTSGAIRARARVLGVRKLAEPIYGLPTHEYTPADHALRDWRCAEPGQLAWRVA